MRETQMNHIELLEIELDDADREVLGDDLLASYLALGMLADEIIFFKLLLLSTIANRPIIPPFKRVSQIRSNSLIKVVALKTVEAIATVEAITKRMERSKSLSDDTRRSFEENLASHTDAALSLKDEPEFQIAQKIRSKLAAHAVADEIKSNLENGWGHLERKLYFHESLGNSFYPACNVLSFDTLLNAHLRGSVDGGIKQKEFEKLLTWLNNASHRFVVLFNHFSVWLHFTLRDKPLVEPKHFDLDSQFDFSFEEVILPIVTTKWD